MFKGFGFISQGFGFGRMSVMRLFGRTAVAQNIPKVTDFKNEVGLTAGEIYKLLYGRGEVPMKEVKAHFTPKGTIFSAALGWLLREDRIEIKILESGVTVKLK